MKIIKGCGVYSEVSHHNAEDLGFQVVDRRRSASDPQLIQYQSAISNCQSSIPMLARRIIPCLDVADGRVVKGIHFESLRDAGDPVAQAARYAADGADELVFLDISAPTDARRTTLDMVSRVADTVFIPFTV